MNDTEKELLKLAGDLPSWVLQGHPVPGSPCALAQGCNCSPHPTDRAVSPKAWWISAQCPLHYDHHGYLMRGRSWYWATVTGAEQEVLEAYLKEMRGETWNE